MNSRRKSFNKNQKKSLKDEMIKTFGMLFSSSNSQPADEDPTFGIPQSKEANQQTFSKNHHNSEKKEFSNHKNSLNNSHPPANFEKKIPLPAQPNNHSTTTNTTTKKRCKGKKSKKRPNLTLLSTNKQPLHMVNPITYTPISAVKLDENHIFPEEKEGSTPFDICENASSTYSNPIYDLNEHIKKLEESLKVRTPMGYYDDKKRSELEFESLRNEENSLMRQSGATKTANLQENSQKNRFKNPLPNESTRVKLNTKKEESDYINANIINGHKFKREFQIGNKKYLCTPAFSYIATQAPLSNTVQDFWQMVYEQKSPLIVMLAEDISNSDSEDIDFASDTFSIFHQIHKYWPNLGAQKQYGEYFVENLTDDYLEKELNDKYNIVKSFMNDQNNNYFHYLCFKLWHQDDQKDARIVQLIHYTGWPDMCLPHDTMSFMNLIRFVNSIILPLSENNQNHKEPSKDSNTMSVCNNEDPKEHKDVIPPIIVHCLAGVGRTGTFCTVHLVSAMYQILQYFRSNNSNLIGKQLKKLFNIEEEHIEDHNSDKMIIEEEQEKDSKFNFNIYNIVRELKHHRIGMVQKHEQYTFCYKVIDQIRKQETNQP